jgi:glycosyltransferase involved in cell wall biosynthesis
MKKKELHVVYIITKLELGGAQKVCLSLFEGLSQAGHSSLLISGPEGALVTTVRNNPFVYLLPDFKRELSFLGLFQELKNFFHLIRYLKKLKKQFPNLIVHTHSTKAGLIGRWAAFFAGVKKRIHTIHGYAFHAYQPKVVWWAIYMLEFLTSLITSHFVCVSSSDVSIGVKLFPRFKHNYSIIRAAVDWQQFHEIINAKMLSEFSEEYLNTNIQNSQKVFIIGTIACFKKQKNLTDLIHAFNEAYQKNTMLRLEIIGDGALRPELEKMIQNYCLIKVVTLHGWRNSVAPFMFLWDAFALSSLWEGLPCAIVEARLLKLPILSYNTGGIHDVVIHGKNGFLYKQKDWKALADGMIELSTNKELYKKMQNYNENLSDFNNATMVTKHIDLYTNLL